MFYIPYYLAFIETLFVCIICHFSKRYTPLYRFIVILFFLLFVNVFFFPECGQAKEYIHLKDNSLSCDYDFLDDRSIEHIENIPSKEAIRQIVEQEKIDTLIRLYGSKNLVITKEMRDDWQMKKDKNQRWMLAYYQKLQEITWWTPFKKDQEELKFFFQQVTIGLFSPNLTGLAVIIVDTMVYYGFKCYDEFEDMERAAYKFEGYRDLYFFYDALLKMYP